MRNKIKDYIKREYTNTKIFQECNKEDATISISGEKTIHYNSNPYYNTFKKHVLDCLPAEQNTKTELQNVLNDFQLCYLNINTVMHLKRVNCFRHYLQGLPNTLNIAFMYDEIQQVFENITGIDFDNLYIKEGYNEGKKYEFDLIEMSDYYFEMFELCLNIILKENKLKTIDQLELIK